MPLLGQVDVDLNTSHFCPTDLGTQVLGWIWWVLSVHYLACTWPLNPQLGPLPGVASSNLCTELLQPLPPATPLSMSCGCRWLLPHQGSNLILPQILVPSASSGRKSGQEWGLEREGEDPPRPPGLHYFTFTEEIHLFPGSFSLPSCLVCLWARLCPLPALGAVRSPPCSSVWQGRSRAAVRGVCVSGRPASPVGPSPSALPHSL